MYKICVIFLWISLPSYCVAQVSYNGSFETLDHSGAFAKWFIGNNPMYDVTVDSSDAFHGRFSMGVESNSNTSEHGSAAIFQAIKLAGKYSTITVSYNIKFIQGESSNFNFFLNQRGCAAAAGLRSKARHQWDIHPGKPNWKRLTASMPVTDSCSEVLVGFIVSRKLHVLIDSITIYADGVLVKDIPGEETAMSFNGEDVDKYLARHSKVLHNTDDYNHFNDLGFLKNTIGNATVVALGESTHGTKEFFSLRNRVILYLIDSLNFETVTFENEVVPSHQANDMLTKKEFTSVKVVDSLFGRIYQNEEMADLFNQIRARNRLKNHVTIEGFDNQGFYYTIKIVEDIFNKTDPVLAQILQQFKDKTRSYYTIGKYDTLYKIALQLQDSFTSRIKAVKEKMPGADTSWLRGYLVALKNSAYFQYLFAVQRLTKGDASNLSRSRDSIMAENIFWLRARYPNKKIIIVAHNDHISKTGATLNDTTSAMGNFLRNKLGSNYRSYAFLSSEGDATGFTSNGKAYTFQLTRSYIGTYEYYLNRMPDPVFFVNLKDAAGKREFLTNLKVRSIGYGGTNTNQFKPFSLQQAFDGVFFIQKSTHTKSFYF